MDARYKTPLIIIVLVLAAFLGYRVLTMPDQRSATDKISDAIRVLPQGVDKAGEQLQDRTPGQKLGDDVKDMGGKIKDNTQPQ